MPAPPLDALLQRKTPVDEADPDYHPLLQDLQCNILSGHRKPVTHYFFLRFANRQVARAPRFLRALAEGWRRGPNGIDLDSELTSRAKRLLQKAGWAAAGLQADPTPLSGNLFLTSTCYTDVLRPQKPGLIVPADPAFRAGMGPRDAALPPPFRLHDRPVHRSPLGQAPIHALYTVAFDPAEVDAPRLLQKVRTYLRPVLVHEEKGYVLMHPSEPWAIEPFGYRDSISQPLFFQSDLLQRQEHEGAAATVAGGRWRSFAPLDTVLVRDPNGAVAHSCGSYVVFRKLIQDVAAFYAQAETLAARYTLLRDDVADGLIGRRIGGMPLGAVAGDNYNDFDYTHTVCPVHAHVRKVNPRDAEAHEHRIVRRGTVFGPLLKRDNQSARPTFRNGAVVRQRGEPAGDVGLLFMCCQSDIGKGFEFVQGHWANWPNNGADPVAGQLRQGRTNRIGIGNSGLVNDFPSVVQLDAGEYLFAPSLSFLKSL